MSTGKRIKITQTGSIIDQKQPAKKTIKALGLGRPNYFVIKNDTPQVRGMIDKVAYMLEVTEAGSRD